MNEFLKEVLPTLVGGEKLQALFATYNEVRNYGDGEVKTGKDGLRIFVQTGDLNYSSFAVWGIFGGIEMGLKSKAVGEEEARAAQQVMESCYPEISEHLDKSSNVLGVVYAGLSAFDENVAFALKIKKDHPSANIVVVTCNCDERRKRKKLASSEHAEIHSVVICSDCGGRGTMKDILQEVISLWPVGEVG